MIVARRVSRWGARGQRIGEAKNLGPRGGRCTSRPTVLDSDSDVPLVSRGRFSILSTESDNDEEEAGQSVVVAVATGCAVGCDRIAVPTEDSGRRHKRLRISESFVDLTQRDVSGSDTPSVQRIAHRPTRRLTLVGVRPGSTMHCVEQSTTSGVETSEVASEFDDEGSNASGEEDAEVPIVEEVPPVRPSVRVQRAGFELLDHWNLSELFSQRASVVRTIPRFCGVHSASR